MLKTSSYYYVRTKDEEEKALAPLERSTNEFLLAALPGRRRARALGPRRAEPAACQRTAIGLPKVRPMLALSTPNACPRYAQSLPDACHELASVLPGVGR